jgi:integrase
VLALARRLTADGEDARVVTEEFKTTAAKMPLGSAAGYLRIPSISIRAMLKLEGIMEFQVILEGTPIPAERHGRFRCIRHPNARESGTDCDRWDFGKQFRALVKAAGIQNVRIHDLRHAGATILMTLGVPDPIVRKVTGHRSRELERYQHLTPELRANR